MRFAAVLSLLIAPLAHAGGRPVLRAQSCGTSYCAPSYAPPVSYAAPVTYAPPVYTYKQVELIVPLYSALYQPYSEPASTVTEADALLEIVAELRAMRQELAVGRQGPPASAPQLDPATVFGTKCAACHSFDQADDKGGGFTLFTEDGTLRRLSGPDRRSIAELVGKGAMPPPNSAFRLSPQESQAITAYLNVATEAPAQRMPKGPREVAPKPKAAPRPPKQ
jgi:cytochrome c5